MRFKPFLTTDQTCTTKQIKRPRPAGVIVQLVVFTKEWKNYISSFFFNLKLKTNKLPISYAELSFVLHILPLRGAMVKILDIC